MNQSTWDYQLIDDNGVSTCENVPVLIPVGGTFIHEYGTYKVIEHKEFKGKQTEVFCDRIEVSKPTFKVGKYTESMKKEFKINE